MDNTPKSENQQVKEAWVEMFMERATWYSFFTGTVRQPTIKAGEKTQKKTIGQKEIRNAVLSLVRYLNKDLNGNNYFRHIGCHSYFPYMFGIEISTWGEALHCHGVFGAPVNFRKLNDFWHLVCGNSLIEVIQDEKKVVNYALKYAIKDFDLMFYLPPSNIPSPKEPIPLWYSENLKEGHPHLKGLFKTEVLRLPNVLHY